MSWMLSFNNNEECNVFCSWAQSTIIIAVNIKKKAENRWQSGEIALNNVRISYQDKTFTPCSVMVQQRDPSLHISAAMTRQLHRSSLPLWDVHLVMNSARGQLQCQECTLESVTMHSKHLNSFTEDTVMVEGTACHVWAVAMTVTQHMSDWKKNIK